ncbi:putative peptidoglycan lipid II flippase [Marisediminicola sp. UYEF4]|uniref:murein biosynthesis integral membrane protein MurJ n=1 Tax=Marisediminicola sp. UYEF4 TaxID=1756384 RepID=UPI003398A3E5
MTSPPADPAPRPSSGLGRASALLASGTLVSRLLGFVKAILLAATIGQVGSSAGDAFAIGNQLPNNIYALIAGGVLGAILVPQIVRAGLHDDGGQRFINKIVTLGASAFIVIAVIATLAAPLLVALYSSSSEDGGRGFSPEGIALATAFAYWCLPQVLFYALYSLLGEVLNARKAFGPFTWAPVLNNVVAIAGLVAFSLLFGGAAGNSAVEVWDSGRIALLAGSATLGVAAQALVLVLFWKRAGLGFRPDFRWRGVGLGRTGKAAGWVFGMILVTQTAGVVQSNVVSLASGEGAGVLTLQNSWLIFMLPHSVIAVSIATAYFTRMSGHASTGNLAGVREDVTSSLRTIGLFITFASVALIVVAFPFARVFESGGLDNVIAMALVIIAFSVGLVPFSAVFVMQRVFYSLEDTRTPFLVETVKASLFVVGALSCTLLPVEFIGVGVALVTTIACIAQTLLTFSLLRRRLGPIGGWFLVRRHLQYLLAAVLSGAVGIGILVSLGGLAPAGFAQSGLVGAMASIAVIGAGMGVVYLGVLLLMKNPDAGSAVDTVTRRLPRRTRPPQAPE